MGDCEFQWNEDGYEALLASAQVQGECERRARKIKERADASTGAVFALKQRKGRKKGRPYWVVAANSRHAKAKNAKRNTLLKSIDAGRL